MKKAAFGVSLAFLLVLVAPPSQARGHGGFGGHGGFHGGFHGRGFGFRGFRFRGGFRGLGFHGFGFRGPRVVIGLGPGFWWGPAYAWPWYYPPPYYGDAASSVVQPSTDYAEQDAPAPPAQSYSYYCQNARAYYIRTCEQWVELPPTPERGRTTAEFADQAMPLR
jgi:hypothetical protein